MGHDRNYYYPLANRNPAARLKGKYMKWTKLCDAEFDPSPERFYIVWANLGAHKMYYGLNNQGEMVWWLNDEQVRPHMIPTYYMELPPPPSDLDTSNMPEPYKAYYLSIQHKLN